MAELVTENWLLFAIALVIGVLVAWWIFAASRRTRVRIETRPEDAAQPARRNQALIDAAPAASVPVAPPPVPGGLAGVGEAVAIGVTPEPVVAAATEEHEEDDLTRIKGLGPKIAEQLRALGVTRFAQIAGWSDADIDSIDAQLGRFAGRIRRDDWVGQARHLAENDTAGYEARFGKL